MKVGWSIPQSTAQPDESLRFADRCEELGFDSVWVYDHLMPYWLHNAPSLDGWTLVAAVAARTSRVGIGTLVTNIMLRNAGVLAKMAVTADRISRGRLILGLGVGDGLSRKELRSYGFQYMPWKTRLRRLEASIRVLRGIWTGTETSLSGNEGHFHGISRPTPVGRIPVWIGGKHPDLGRLAMRDADGWNLWGITFHGMQERIRSVVGESHASGEFELSWAGGVSRKDKASERVEQSLGIGGEPQQAVAQLEFLQKIGIRHVILYPERGLEFDLLEWFAHDVFPIMKR